MEPAGLKVRAAKALDYIAGEDLETLQLAHAVCYS
jgi:hypothetical protein